MRGCHGLWLGHCKTAGVPAHAPARQSEWRLRERERALAAERSALLEAREEHGARDALLEAFMLRLHATEGELARWVDKVVTPAPACTAASVYDPGTRAPSGGVQDATDIACHGMLLMLRLQTQGARRAAGAPRPASTAGAAGARAPAPAAREAEPAQAAAGAAPQRDRVTWQHNACCLRGAWHPCDVKMHPAAQLTMHLAGWFKVTGRGSTDQHTCSWPFGGWH